MTFVVPSIVEVLIALLISFSANDWTSQRVIIANNVATYFQLKLKWTSVIEWKYLHCVTEFLIN